MNHVRIVRFINVCKILGQVSPYQRKTFALSTHLTLLVHLGCHYHNTVSLCCRATAVIVAGESTASILARNLELVEMGIGKNKVCCWILAIECLFFELVLVVNPVDITKRQRIVLFACVLAHGAEKVKKVQERGEKGKKGVCV